MLLGYLIESTCLEICSSIHMWSLCRIFYIRRLFSTTSGSHQHKILNVMFLLSRPLHHALPPSPLWIRSMVVFKRGGRIQFQNLFNILYIAFSCHDLFQALEFFPAQALCLSSFYLVCAGGLLVCLMYLVCVGVSTEQYFIWIIIIIIIKCNQCGAVVCVQHALSATRIRECQ